MNFTPEISIITVNYNGFADTCQLCESIFKIIQNNSFELLVIDNGSKENECEKLKILFPDIIGIRSDINLGFSGGNNLGIKRAKGKFILLINNDTFICKDNLHFLAETLSLNFQMAAVSPKICFSFPPNHIQFAGYTPLSKITLRNNIIGFNQPDNGQYDIPYETPMAHGAAMMIKREIIDIIGLMPEIYFLYYEELDWCTKMTEAGYKLGYDPRCTLFHKESQSTGQESPLRIYYLTRNRLLFAWRNRRGYIKWLALGYQIFIAYPIHIICYCLKNKINFIGAMTHGIIDFFKLENKKT